MIEEFFLNLAGTSANILPIVIMTIVLASFVGWIESNQKQKVKVKKEKRNGK